MDQTLVLSQVSNMVAGGFNACDHVENGQRYILVTGVPTINMVWILPATDILISVPNNYPIGGLDAFYADKKLILKNGQKHPRMQAEHNILGRMWLLVSWHYNKPWSPNQDTLLSHIYHCQDYFKKGSRSN